MTAVLAGGIQSYQIRRQQKEEKRIFSYQILRLYSIMLVFFFFVVYLYSNVYAKMRQWRQPVQSTYVDLEFIQNHYAISSLVSSIYIKHISVTAECGVSNKHRTSSVKCCMLGLLGWGIHFRRILFEENQFWVKLNSNSNEGERTAAIFSS